MSTELQQQLLSTKTEATTQNNRRVFERNWDDLNKPKLALIGSCFSIATMATFFPFELAKTRLQSEQYQSSPALPHEKLSATTTAAARIAIAQQNANNGRLFPLLKQIYASNGAKGLFRGFWTAAIGNCLVEWVYYAAYENTRQKLHNHFNDSIANGTFDSEEEREACIIRNDLIKESFSGVISEASCETIAIPFDIVAQRLMIQELGKTGFSYKGGFDAVRQIYQAEGLRGFFKGFGASLLTHAPESAIWWIIYMNVKKQLYLSQPESWVEQTSKQGSFLIHLAAGTVAGGLTATFCNPLDVVKTRLQVQNSKSTYRYRNFFHALRMIPRQEGMGAFTNGMFAKILYMAPVSGLHIALYELVKRMSGNEEEEDD